MINSFENFLEESGLNKYYKDDESLNIKLYHDLNIYGDIAESYIELLSDKYNVDVSRFCFSDYFPEEFPGDSFFQSFLYSVATFLKTRHNSKKKFKAFTFFNIKNSIEKGVLN